jgi:F-type H+-transporting ATPase subunit a
MLPSVLSTFAEAAEPEVGWNIFWYSGLLILIVLGFTFMARKGISKRTFTNLPARLAEHLVLFLEGMAVNVIGPHGKKYVPFLSALWLYIFTGNVMGLVFNFTPTAEWSLNLSLALITVIYVQYEGIKTNGLFGHIKHFAGPKLGGFMVVVSGLIFMVEIVSECMKLVSLSLRLYGNIHGGHIVVSSLNHIVNFPFGGLLLPIKFFTCIIQAFVFVILACTYLSMVTSHGHDDDHDSEAGHETANPHHGSHAPEPATA